MGKTNVIRTVRKNSDYIAATRELDALKLRWELRAPSGTGHPFLLIEDKVRFSIGCSPGGRHPGAQVVARLRMRLRETGLAAPKEGTP